MSVSTQAAPKQMSFGRMPSVLAVLALITVIAVAVSLVALNGTKTAAPATTGAKGAPPPAFIDHGWSKINEPGQVVTGAPYNDHGASRINEPGMSVTNVPFYDHDYSQTGTSAAPIPYTGPLYYSGTTAYPPFGSPSSAATGTGSLGYPPFGVTTSKGAAGYPLFGASYFPKTIDSPYVAPRPRNQ
jgi:hypothetical protein